MTDYTDSTPYDPTVLHSVADSAQAIRTKMYGKDTREAMAQMGEKLVAEMTDTGYNGAETRDARGSFNTLGARENSQDTQIATKSDKSYVDTMLSSIAQGGPKGIYYSLSALQTAYPNGADGTYLVFDSSSTDGAHSYIWDSSAGAWKDLGVYQATGVQKKFQPSFYGGVKPITIDWTVPQMKIPAGSTFFTLDKGYPSIGGNVAIPSGGAHWALNPSGTTLAEKIQYFGSLEAIPSDYIYIGWTMYNFGGSGINSSNIVGCYDPLTLPNASFPSTKLSLKSRRASLLGTKPILISWSSSTLTIQSNSSSYVITSVESFPIQEGSVTIPTGGGYIAFNPIGTTLAEQILFCSGQKLILEDYIYLGYYANNLSGAYSTDLQGYISTQNSTDLSFYGKNGTFLGDSTTQGYDGSGNYDESWSWVAYLQALCGFANVNNAGLGGTNLAAVTNTHGDGMATRVDDIKSQDLVTVMGGINDFLNKVPLGTFDSTDKTNFYGALRYIIETLSENNPNAILLMITPFKINNYVGNDFKGGAQNPDGTYNKNSAGYTELDYVNAIKEVAAYYSIPVLDLFNECVFSYYLSATVGVYTNDKVHPSRLGYKVLSRQIASKINSL